MDMNGRDQFEVENGDDSNSMNYNPPSMSSDWRFMGTNLTNAPMILVPTSDHTPICSSSCSSAPMVDSFGQTLWGQPSNSANPGSGINVQNITNSSNPMAWNATDLISKESFFLPSALGSLPHSLPQFPADSGFIERAARFSCFSAGNFSVMMNNPFGGTESMTGLCSRAGETMQRPQDVLIGNGSKLVCGGQSHKTELTVDEIPKGACLVVEHKETEVSPMNKDRKSESLGRSKEESKQGLTGTGNESDGAEFTGVNGQEEPSSLEGTHGEPSVKGLSSKKRKRVGQDTVPVQSEEAQEETETEKDKDENKEKDEPTPTSDPYKTAGKNEKQETQASDPSKGDYIHVRARRGQATNSHSLAERVRREKISDRMKLLQDLVPGCNKVTGKAVMLDEIINYVQSLQRQVEFLSMKLATVSPRLDFNNMETLHSRPRPSSTLGFTQDLSLAYHPQLHQSQPDLIPLNHPSFNPSGALQRSINPDSPSFNGATSEGFKQQLPGVWDNELHNVVHMSFNAPSNIQEDTTGAASPGRTKAEL